MDGSGLPIINPDLNTSARARILQKKRCQWTAREKLMIIAYYEQDHSK